MLENENMIDLFGSLKEMSSEQLSRLIQEETAKECPNDDLVLIALDILEDREKDNSVELGPKGKAAWKKYQSKVRVRNRKTVLVWKPLLQVASAVLVVTLLFALLPTQANAETWWERLARWTDDFFSFFNPNESELPEDAYIFQTDIEGLQQVYDAVVELGITEPVVPMWLPAGYVLSEKKTIETPAVSGVIAKFSNDSNMVLIQVNVLNDDKPNQYYKDLSPLRKIERSGIVFNILQNNDNTIAIWTVDNIECSIVIDDQENIMDMIIESIYRRRNV